MSDCRVPEPQGYDVARLRIEFQDGEVPWMYPLALNGRSIQGVYVDGVRYERVRECEKVWTGMEMICSSCAFQLTNQTHRYCPWCGARVKEGGE